VRYEEFVNPLQVCNRLFEFAFSGYQQADGSSLQVGGAMSRGKTHEMLSSRLCHNYFSPKVLSLTASSKPQSKTSHMYTRGVGTANSKKDESSSSSSSSSSVRINNKQQVPSLKKNAGNATKTSALQPRISNHRHLRLRSTYDNLVFMPELVHDSGLRRIRDFDFSFQHLNTSIKNSLLMIESELKGFGYSLFAWHDGSSAKPQSGSRDISNKLHPWEL